MAHGAADARSRPEDRRAPARAKLRQLQILRYLAALMVAAAHSIHLLEERAGAFVLERAHQLGLTAIDVFFLISGFIMVHTSEGEFAAKGAPRRFLEKRLIRIVPIYTILSLVAYAVASFGSDGGIGCRKAEPLYLLASLAFLPMARCDGALLPILSQGWTLNYEAVFYLVFALALLLPRRGALALLAAVFGALSALPVLAPNLVAASPQLAFYASGLTLLFVAGAGLGALHRRTGPLFCVARPFPALLLLVLAVLAAEEAAFEAGLLDRAALAALGSLIIVSAALFLIDPAESFGPLGSFAADLGDASYSLYLVHTFVLTALAKVFEAAGAWPLGWIVFMAVYLAFCSLVGALTFRIIERPATRRLRALAGLSAPAPARLRPG